MKKAFFSIAALSALAFAGSAQAGTKIGNNMAKCRAGSSPAILVTVRGVKSSTGKMRVQSYRANSREWMKKGRWINRIESRARGGTMSFCMPVPSAGRYGIAIRHDKNGNGKTDIRSDGGGISNNPSINIFNLGKPSYKRVGVNVGNGVKRITINMKYM